MPNTIVAWLTWEGEGVPQHYEQASDWIRKAAQQSGPDRAATDEKSFYGVANGVANRPDGCIMAPFPRSRRNFWLITSVHMHLNRAIARFLGRNRIHSTSGVFQDHHGIALLAYAILLLSGIYGSLKVVTSLFGIDADT